MQKIDDLILESIDETLSLYGEAVKNQVYILLGKSYSITRSELPQHIPDFSRLLNRLFGSHARLVELKIMESLYSKVTNTLNVKHEIVLDERTFNFTNYVDKLYSATNLY